MDRQIHIGCMVPGCGGKHRGKGYCSRHYQQIMRHGKIINISKGKHMGTDAIEEDKPVEAVKVKPRKKLPYMTPVQLAHSNSDVFWAWWGGTSPRGGVEK